MNKNSSTISIMMNSPQKANTKTERKSTKHLKSSLGKLKSKGFFRMISQSSNIRNSNHMRMETALNTENLQKQSNLQMLKVPKLANSRINMSFQKKSSKKERQCVVKKERLQTYKKKDSNNDSLMTSQSLDNALNKEDKNDVSIFTLLIDSVIKIDQSNVEERFKKEEGFELLLKQNHQFLEKTVRNKINFHLRAIRILSDFTEVTRNIFDEDQEWEELTFLIYKKYYLQHLKIKNCLKKYPIKNPFILKQATIPLKEVLFYIKTEEGKQHLKIIEKQNKLIEQNLRDYYNKIIEKSGGKINLLTEDSNFNDLIYNQLYELLIYTEFQRTNPNRIKKMCRIIQISFLISELDSKFILKITEAQKAIHKNRQSQFIRKYKQIFIQNFTN